MNNKKFNPNIYFGITGFTAHDLKLKIDELDALKINKAALFLSRLSLDQRLLVYDYVLNSNIKELPLVHLRDDMELWEIELFYKKFNARYFTIHQNHFLVLDKWKKFAKLLYLEFGMPKNKILNTTKMERIGGFCVDLSHFKFQDTAKMVEVDFMKQFKDEDSMFACNHLNAYDAKNNKDLHLVNNAQELDYLLTLPSFVFSNHIAIEMDNSIKEQLGYKEYIITLFRKIFN